MNILFLTQVLPYPLDAGPKIRAYYVLKYLSQKFKITLLSLTRAGDHKEAIEHLEAFCDIIETVEIKRSSIKDMLNFFRSLINREPFLITRDSHQGFEEKMIHLLNKRRYDAIHADQLWMAKYALKSSSQYQNSKTAPKKVLDQHNAVYVIPKRMAANDSNPFLSYILQRESRLLAQYEIKTCSQFDSVVWVTREDYESLSQIFQNNEGAKFNKNKFQNIIPICIEPDNYKPNTKIENNQKIVFIGGMHWPPNREGVNWFIKHVLPIIKEKSPDLTCVIVGKNPSHNIDNQSGIQFTGYVADLDPIWRQARVFIVPLLSGGGMRVKILEAWANGIPVVSTSVGAEGIACTNDADIIIADTAVEFAEGIIKILKDPGLSQYISKSARDRVEELYDWKKTYHQWDVIYS